MTTAGLGGWSGKATPEGSERTSPGRCLGRVLPGEGTVSAKALGLGVPCRVAGIARRPVWLRAGRQEREAACPWGLAANAEHLAFCPKFSNVPENHADISCSYTYPNFLHG